jgi:hypothetical protein
MIDRIVSAIRAEANSKRAFAKPIRFIGLNGVGYYGDSDTCMRTFDLPSHHDTNCEIRGLETEKARRGQKWKVSNDAGKLEKAKKKFDEHVDQRKCHMIVYEVGYKLLRPDT